jgi:hypothetical protein
MGRLDPHTGVRNGAQNPNPRFFDSSWVYRPADRTGYMLKKVAYEVQGYDSGALGDLVDDLNFKAAEANKVAVIDKLVRGYPAAVVSDQDVPNANLIEQYRNTTLPTVVTHTQELPLGHTQKLAQFNLPQTLATLSRAGIILTTPEFIRIFIEKAMPGTQVPEHVLDNLTSLQAEVFDLFAKNPSLLNKTLEPLTEGVTDEPALQAAVEPLMEKRSTIGEYLQRRIVPQAFRHDEAPMTELLEVQDPNSGRVYQTTRGAARAGHDEVAKTRLMKLLGGAGMLAGAYKVLTSSPKLRPLALPLGIGGVAIGSGGLDPIPEYKATSGEGVPYLSEFREKQSHVLDLVHSLGMDYGITKTGAQRLNRVYARTTPTSSLYPLMRKLASLGFRNSQLTLHGMLHDQDKTASDGICEEQLDFDKVANVLGTLAWGTPGN